MIRILVIDDDSELCDLLSDYLQPEGFAVETAGDALLGVERAISGDHSLVVLDVMLPGLSGFEALNRIRAVSAIPVLMLTARGEEVDRIVGLEMGADDYLPKPFNPRELVARMRAIRRRTGESARKGEFRPPDLVFAVGDVVLDPGARVVRCAERRVNITSAEFSLLQELMQRAGQVVSREHLAETVLGRKLMLFDRSIDVHVSSLRRKLGPTIDGVERIKTVRGVGYLYTMPQAKC